MPNVRRGILNDVVPGSLWSKGGHIVIVLARHLDVIVVLDAYSGVRTINSNGWFLWDHMYVMGAA